MLRNRLIILSGLPGSGKSTYCRQYKELYEANNIKVNIVSSDEIRMELFGKYDNFNNEKLVWTTFHERATKLAEENFNVTILDATTLTNKQRYNYALRYKDLYKQIYLVVMDTPIEQCLIQNKLRPENKWVPENVIRDMNNRFEPIDRYTCFSYFFSVENVKPNDRIRLERI